MVGGLAQISSHIQAGVQDIGDSTADILASVSRHTESASLQSAAINQTSSTVNELRVAAEDTAQLASEVADRANDSLQVSNGATSAVTAIASAMEEIRERVDAIARDIVTLSERTQQIGEITATVNGLADRSKLLALNASIEAARAGEHGRGFAVVAEEVTKLAEQSKDATAQVEAILSDVEAATERGSPGQPGGHQGGRARARAHRARRRGHPQSVRRLFRPPATPPSRSLPPPMSRASASSRSLRP